LTGWLGISFVLVLIRKAFLDSLRKTFMNISKFKRLGVKISEKLIFMVFKSDDMEWYWLLSDVLVASIILIG
jgi:hypothetical protein